MAALPVSEKICSLSKVDLNFLTIFCLIYSVGSISKVADMLDISASAVSQSLRKLREMMGDNLFVRSGNILLPTVFSDELYDNTISIIDKLSTLLPDSTPSRKKRVTLYTESFISPLVVPELTEKLLETNSDISLLHRTEDLNEQKTTELLNMRQADVVFSTFSVENSNIRCQKVCDIDLVLVAAQDNPLYGSTIDEELFRNASLVGYNTKNEKIIYYLSIADKKFRSSERCLLTTSFASILIIIAKTPCLGIIPERAFATYSEMYKLRRVGTPFPLPKFSIYSSYRKESNKLLSTVLDDLLVPTT